MPLTPDQRLLHYRLLAPLGAGGMGVVWQAEDTKLGRTVALKFLPPEVSHDAQRREQFLNEARLASTLNDPGVVQVYALESGEGQEFIAMEYVAGEPLDRRLARGALAVGEAVSLGRSLARTLARAHARGLVHRDVKPANVLVTPTGEAKLVDFGLAALFAPSAEGADDRTQPPGAGAPATSGGTLAYMAPERLHGGVADAGGDVWSLGVVLYEALAGRRPFTGANATELIARVAAGRAEPLGQGAPDVPEALAALVERCLVGERSRRTVTAAEVERELARIERGLERGEEVALVRPAAAGGSLARWLVASVALVAVAVAAWWFGPWRGGVTDSRMVVVFPFEVQGQSEGAAFVGQAFAEAMAVNLSGVVGVHVIAVQGQPSGGRLTNDDREQLARHRGAGRYITGQLLRVADSVQVNATMVDVGTGRIVWGAVRTTSERGFAGLASDLVQEMVERLTWQAPKLYDMYDRWPGSSRLASSATAVAAVAALHDGAIPEGLAATERLVTELGDEPQTYVLRALALEFAFQEDSRADTVRLGRALTMLASLDHSQPYIAITRAFAEADAGRTEQAIATMGGVAKRSDLSPALRSQVLRNRAQWLSRTGRVDASLRDMKAALALEPANGRVLENYAYVLESAGRYEDALVAAQGAVALSPGYWRCDHRMAIQLYHLGRYSEAASRCSTASALAGQVQSVGADYACFLWLAGRRAESEVAGLKARDMPASRYGLYNLAHWWLLMGDRTRALTTLRRAVQAGFADRYIETDKQWQVLRGDPEFKRLEAEVRKRLAGN